MRRMRPGTCWKQATVDGILKKVSISQSKPHDPFAFLPGGGEMGERIRAFDWAGTPLGPVEHWSAALRTTLRIILANRFPHLLWWGPEYIQLYNDAYAPIPGAKHPDRALGRAASECWAEIWDVIGPLIDRPFRGGPPTWDEDILLEVQRYGFTEESHFTIAYSPVPDETAPGGIGGVLGTVHEITDQIIGQRRTGVLRDLAARIGDARTAEEACAIAANVVSAHDKDIPFALLYLIDPDLKRARLAGCAGAAPYEDISPAVIGLERPIPGIERRDGIHEVEQKDRTAWPLSEAATSEATLIVEQLAGRFDAVPPGPWSDPPDRAVVIPIPSNRPHETAALMVAGISARLVLDQAYRDFFGLVKTQVATAIANARSYEEERKRAEALAELDRAKTAFFSNVSHEFRTPLTLMLGPIEEMLRRYSGLSPAARAQLEIVDRNGMRLLRLVNTLLDFSRIEAGRVQAIYQPTDLASFTADLASMFRAAIERAGLRLAVDCPTLPEPVYVDPDMWEKIVLNLLSNAFKFTLQGSIEIRLRAAGEAVELRVADTGTGIPAGEMPHLFERFHRVQNARGRTHEGSGIGLALVQELVRLHGGTIGAESELGKGTTFIVRMPLGKAHLPPDQVTSETRPVAAAGAAKPYVEEAMRWLPAESGNENALELADHHEVPAVSTNGGADSESRPRVLVADDNADMRQYVARLLGDRYQVRTASDGESALSAVRQWKPDLILTDVMMPRLDGFGLLREVRGDAALRETPLIMLSARAGEESRVEGMDAGADDYLVKPFSARELIARVEAHLKMALMRREAAEVLRRDVLRKSEFLSILAHELRNPLAPIASSLELLKRLGDRDSASAEARNVIQRQLSHLIRLVDDLLDISRITRDKLELRTERIALDSVIRQSIEGCRPLFDEYGHRLEIKFTPANIYLSADPVRLVQVFENLLNNACKYTEPGGTISVTVERENDVAIVSVRDTGMGIPPERLGEVFEMFSQVHSGVRTQGGLGIGLAVVKRLVEMHEGTVEARSKGPGHGAEFIVRLPVADEERATEQPATEQPALGRAAQEHDALGAGHRILIVDDNEDAAETLARLLEFGGNSVQTAHDGLAALEATQRFDPQVVLLDIGLPKMDGYEVCRTIRRSRTNRRPLVVALTGWGQDDDRKKTKEAGFDYHLVKPVNFDLLTEILNKAGAAAGVSDSV
jgi:signal transduction histidine kinase